MSEHEDIIVIKPKERTPKEQKMLDINYQVDIRLKEKLARATTLAEFVFNYYGIRLHNSPGSDDWIWDYDEPTEEAVLEFYQSDTFRKEATRDTKVVQKLIPALQDVKGDPSNIQIILKRIRDSHGYYKYGILAQFPRGIQAENPVLGQTPLELTQTNPDIIFFRPTTTCVEHACDDLYKIHRNSVFGIPYRTREQAIESLQHDEHGTNEYQLKKTTEEVAKQDAGNYITVGLQSAFSNEPYVIPVSRFWLSQKEK